MLAFIKRNRITPLEVLLAGTINPSFTMAKIFNNELSILR